MANAQFLTLGPFFSSGSLCTSPKLYHYAAGTSTLKNIWSDRGEITTLAQPFVGDANGVFNFFADGLYKLVIKDSADNTLYTLDNFLIQDFLTPTFAEGSAIASASTVAVGPEVWAHITGTTTIDALSGTIPFFWAVFDGALTLTHSSNLLLFNSVSRKTNTGDVMLFLNEGSGVWRQGSECPAAKQTDIASASTVTPPPNGSFVDITGTTTITGLASINSGHTFKARFTGAGLNITYNATTMITQWARDYRTVPNEVLEFVSLGAGNWLCYSLNGPKERVGTTIESNTGTAPAGYLDEDGTAVSRTTYSGLFAEIANASSATITVTIASPGVVTWTSHGLENGQPVAFTTTGALPTGITANTQYYVSGKAVDTFKISATIGGAEINTSGTQSGTHTGKHARYGVGDNSTTFNLPDRRGRIGITVDGAAARITSSSTNGTYADVLGGVGGAETHTLVTSEMPAHPGHLVSGTGISNLTGGINLQNDSTGGGGAHNNTQPWIAKKHYVRF